MNETTNNKDKIYFVTGGGTGGHIYPAVAVGFALQKEADTDKVYYVGNPENLEKKIAEEKVFEDFLPVDITALPKTFSFDFVKWSFKLAFATAKSIGYILKYFTMGQLLSLPIIIFGLFLIIQAIKNTNNLLSK